MDDVAQVGGKNASLGELIRDVEPQGVRVPHGFAVTSTAYYHYLKETGLDIFIEKTLKGLNTRNLKELSRCGKLVRDTMRKTPLPKDLEKAILEAYTKMEKQYGKNTDVAVRSSATAEDLPGASFAGEQETYLNIRGGKDVIRASIWTMASLFTDRAISYRADKGYDHMKVALSVGVQKMVRSDKGASGVMFTVDTESGFRDVVVVNATYGLGEMIVQGHVTPDEYLVSKSRIGTAKSPFIPNPTTSSRKTSSPSSKTTTRSRKTSPFSSLPKPGLPMPKPTPRGLSKNSAPGTSKSSTSCIPMGYRAKGGSKARTSPTP